MTTARPAALVLGSCRVFRPLRHVHHDGRIRITDIDGPAWFTHSVAEARQLVEVLAGECAVPGDLRSLVCENLWGGLSVPLGSRALDAVDVVVLEVSTTKSYTVGETRLNMHCLWNAARGLDLPTRDVLRGAPVTWPERAGRLRELQVGRADPDEIRADVSAIAALTGAPVVLVDHIDTRPEVNRSRSAEPSPSSSAARSRTGSPTSTRHARRSPPRRVPRSSRQQPLPRLRRAGGGGGAGAERVGRAAVDERTGHPPGCQDRVAARVRLARRGRH